MQRGKKLYIHYGTKQKTYRVVSSEAVNFHVRTRNAEHRVVINVRLVCLFVRISQIPVIGVQNRTQIVALLTAIDGSRIEATLRTFDSCKISGVIGKMSE